MGHADDYLLITVQNWLSYLKSQRNYSTHTYKAYRQDIRDFIAFLNEYYGKVIELSDIKEADIRTFRSWLARKNKKNIAPSSSARAIASLINFYRFLMDNKLLDGSSILSLKKPKKAILMPRALTQTQTMRCISHMQENQKDWNDLRDVSLLM